MKVDGTGAINYPAGYETKHMEKHAFGTGFLNGAKDKEAPEQAALPRQVPLMDIYNKMKLVAGNGEPVPLQAGGKGQEQEVGHPAKGEGTDGKASTEIIVKPDGSRGLVMTMCIGGYIDRGLPRACRGEFH